LIFSGCFTGIYNMAKLKRIIVFGASAGGIPAISTVISGLPADLDAAVFVVLHVSSRSSAANLARIFQKHTGLICKPGTDGELILPGHLYIASPNYHMMLKDGRVRTNQGTRENKYRPSIDVLFRSAAVAYGVQVVGVVLTGLLEDGTSGMSAIKRCGGICIVQEPEDAEYSDMPQSVLNKIRVDHQVPLTGMSDLLKIILREALPEPVPVPRELQVEAEITENMMTTINDLKKIGDKSDFVCPDCGGSLYAVKNDPVPRYRCHTGHVYTENTLYDVQGLHLEESVWVSIRMLEERYNMLQLMATHSREANMGELAASQVDRASEMEKHIERLKIVLAKLTQDLPPIEIPAL
jgi:two-component system chemotaxis response regulator CheB